VDSTAWQREVPLKRVGELSVLALVLTPILLILVGVSVVVPVLLASLIVS
jgi:hypothetical protein